MKLAKDDIHIGTKNGCLTVVGDLNTYNQDEALEKIKRWEEEKQEFIDGTWKLTHNGNVDSVDYFDFWIRTEQRRAKELLYKCQCKCGKLHFVSPELFLAKRHRYCDIINPSDADWNTARLRQPGFISHEHKQWMIENGCGLRLLEREKKISNAQHVPDKYYNKQLNLKCHDTLEIIGDGPDRETICEYKNKMSVRLSKTYRSRCHLCGKESLFTYDDFEIRNDEYGPWAYDGYYSKAKCACHPVSSFQWRTIKILVDNNIEYSAEISFDDLHGAGGKNLLRYDFGIYDSGKLKALVECQGKQHYYPSEEFGVSSFALQQKNDALKREYALKRRIKLIEIPYTLNTINKEAEFLLAKFKDESIC
jgi:hypothetical protein